MSTHHQARAAAAAEPLLPRQQRRDGPPVDADDDDNPPPERRGGTNFNWIATLVGFAFLTFNSGMAMYRSNGDHEVVAFVVFSYLDLVALLVSLKRYETAEPGSRERDRLKVAVWLLTTALTLSFSYKVAAIMPPAAALVVWLLAFATVAGGFYSFFCYGHKK